MKKSNILKRLFATFSTFLVLIGSIQSQTVSKDYEDGKLFVKIKSNYLTSLSFINNNGANNNLPISTLPFLQSVDKKYKVKELTQPFIIAKDAPELQRIYQLTIADIWRIDAVVKYLNKQEGVEYAEKVPLRYSQLTPNDPSYLLNQQWYLNKIGATSAWDKIGTYTVVVAIVDGGVQITHPDLAANIWVNPSETIGNGLDDDGNGRIDDINGWDIANNDNSVSPDLNSQDHGTHVAGLVAAVTNNASGIASIGGLTTKLMILKHSTAATGTSLINYIDGVFYAINNGAKVVNMSLGSGSSSQAEQAIFDYGYSKGVIFVAAMGNESAFGHGFPAAYNNVIGVCATDINDVKATFSNYSPKADISAPGSNIYSTITSSNYGTQVGTSMATPIVAGTISAILSKNPGLTPNDVETLIKSTSVNIYTLAANATYSNYLGAGRLDANAALTAAANSLTWTVAPLFSANNTTISAGGSVSFSNLTKNVFSPTTYTWSFQGGLPATSTSTNPPAIVYNTPGTYSVALRASNSNGAVTYSVVSYITVNTAPICSIINYPVNGPGASVKTATWIPNAYFLNGPDFFGFPTGTSNVGSKEIAMYFDVSAQASTLLQGVGIQFAIVNKTNPSALVSVKIYSATSISTAPGTVLGSVTLTKNELYKKFKSGSLPVISFVDNPINIPNKKFFVSINISNLSFITAPAVRDSLCITSNQVGGTNPSDVWEFNNSSIWRQFGTSGTWPY